MANATAEGVRALGALIRSRRRDLELTLEQVAERASISVGYLGNIEKGYINPKRGPVVPSDSSLRGIATALELPIEDLHRALGRIPRAEDCADVPPELAALGINYEAGFRDIRPEKRPAALAAIAALIRGFAEDQDENSPAILPAPSEREPESV